MNAPFCTNCGETGHMNKQCLQPITSFGTILFRLKDITDPSKAQATTLLQSESAINGIDQSRLEYLLIQRRDSLGYIDIMRGKYKPTDTEYITQQVRGMTTVEQKKLLTDPFDVLWEALWGPPTEGSNAYKHEKDQSRQKLDTLRAGAGCVPLSEILETVGRGWMTPEWGFPKGRRDTRETEYACAIREMREETGLTEQDVVPIRNLEPIREVFFGSNHIQYSHKYFILFVPRDVPVALDPNNEHMRREIGDIRWCSLEEALALIRPENVEKREVLLRVSRLLRNYCPLLTRAA
jgi:8-oxo-dGTP pyrophosphatase MutT (NUDIX family)